MKWLPAQVATSSGDPHKKNGRFRYQTHRRRWVVVVVSPVAPLGLSLIARLGSNNHHHHTRPRFFLSFRTHIAHARMHCVREWVWRGEWTGRCTWPPWSCTCIWFAADGAFIRRCGRVSVVCVFPRARCALRPGFNGHPSGVSGWLLFA